MTALAILLLAGGTYAFRVCGPVLHRRVVLPARVRWAASVSASVLLCALAATSAVSTGHAFAGWARPAGVLVGGVLAVRGAPFLVTVVAAVVTTAVLRLLGVP